MRYAIVSNYYKTGSTETQTQVQNLIQGSSIVLSGIKELDQKPVHPSLKKLIGKKPVNYLEILNSGRSMRKAAREASSIAVDENLVKIKPSKAVSALQFIEPPSTLQHPQLTSSRGKNQLKHTIVVGNTSQYMHEQSNSNITHKWMCYVKTKSSVGVERMVKKVRFHLDQSYKPNDVVDVTTSPFQLTRRGYGEFPIKVLIFFKDDLQLKPVQIIHQLNLDTKYSGHQTLGNETVSELWTRNFLLDECGSTKPIEPQLECRSHLMDHNYYKPGDAFHLENQEPSNESTQDVYGKAKSVENNSNYHLKQHREVNQWIKSIFPDFIGPSEEKICHINIEDNEKNGSEEFDVVRIPDRLKREDEFIELTNCDIGLTSSSFSEASKLLLTSSLRSFVKQLVENSFLESCLRDDKIVTESDVAKAFSSRPEFDFLIDVVRPKADQVQVQL